MPADSQDFGGAEQSLAPCFLAGDSHALGHDQQPGVLSWYFLTGKSARTGHGTQDRQPRQAGLMRVLLGHRATDIRKAPRDVHGHE